MLNIINMATKTIETVLTPPPAHMVGDGFRVHNFFPGGYRLGNRRMSPFFMLDYNSKIALPPTEIQKGVGVHPHRGFETVTIAYHGKIAHHDSAGNSGIIGEGEVQWMTAASGVLHKEYHEKEFSRKGGLFQMVQLWVNLPAKYKMSPPRYQALAKEKMSKYELSDAGSYIDIIAGEYKAVKGSAQTFTPLHVYNVYLKKGDLATFSFPAHYNTAALIIEGAVKVNANEEAPVDHFVLFQNEGELFELNALEDSTILILSGEPINEPVAAYGPFLMNTQEELQQAVEDFNIGKFGFLEA